MIPLTAIAFIFSFFMIYRQNYKYIIIAMGFLFMGYVGAKRGLWLYLPVVLSTGIFFYFKIIESKTIPKRLIRSSVIIMIFSVLTIILGAKYTRSLNPENKIGGSFELNYLKNYTIDYTFSTSSEDELSQGRGANFISVITNMKSAKWINLLFGYGPESGKGVATYGEGIWKTLGVNGPITGLTYHLVQLGILSNILIVFIIIRLSLSFLSLSKSESDPYLKAIIFGGFMVTIVFFIDFLTYSNSFFSTLFPLSFSFAYFSAIIYKTSGKSRNYLITARI
ncbi:MAG: hypothetical protein GX180_09280 [Enterococcus sp.]|nr:hypothetical protein [Enterococcus sp.]